MPQTIVLMFMPLAFGLGQDSTEFFLFYLFLFHCLFDSCCYLPRFYFVVVIICDCFVHTVDIL